MPGILPQDRLVDKVVSLGTIREFEPPQEHIGLREFAPFQHAETDDVIFTYTRGMTDGLAPARAEDAESELAGKDTSFGSGSASIIDWALKHHYDPSDVTRYRDSIYLQGLGANLPLTVTNIRESFDDRVARNTRSRSNQLYNRIEWLIMKAMDTGAIAYNDGNVIFSVNYGRPTAQQDVVPPNGYWDVPGTTNPIDDLLQLQATAYDTYGVRLSRAYMSTRVFRALRKNDRFVTAVTAADPLYVVRGWNDQKAADWIREQSNLDEFVIYDSVYRTKPKGSNVVTNNKFMRDNVVLLMPSRSDVEAIDDAIGFGKTLTSPHVEGNWASGFYEWEKDDVDPWGHDMGTGIKAFPVIPHLDKTWVLKVFAS